MSRSILNRLRLTKTMALAKHSPATLGMGFFAVFSLSDCAARVFAQWRTSERQDGYMPDRTRRILREEAVKSLRWLWQNGDAEARHTVACRVRIWMKRDRNASGVDLVAAKIVARERVRLGERSIG